MGALATQFLMLWRSRRFHMLAAFVAVALLILAYSGSRLDFAGRPQSSTTEALFLFRVVLNIMSVAGFMWGILVWRDETPSKRTYHWSLPVSLREHDVARIAGGALWLCILAACVCIVTRIGQGAIHLRTDLAPHPLFWLNMFTAALVPYLIASAITVASERPYEWIMGGFVVVLIALVANLTSTHRILVIDRVFFGTLGISRALSGAWFLNSRMPYAIFGVNGLSRVDLWIAATLLWLSVGGICVALSVSIRGAYRDRATVITSKVSA